MLGIQRRGPTRRRTTTDRHAPVDVVGLDTGVAALAAGGGHTCALTVAGGVKCWGRNDYGQLGDGQACGSGICPIPVDVAELTSGVSAIAADEEHTCAVTVNGTAKCWGVNLSGELGDGTTHNWRTRPVDVVQLDGACTLSCRRRCTYVCADGGRQRKVLGLEFIRPAGRSCIRNMSGVPLQPDSHRRPGIG